MVVVIIFHFHLSIVEVVEGDDFFLRAATIIIVGHLKVVIIVAVDPFYFRLRTEEGPTSAKHLKRLSEEGARTMHKSEQLFFKGLLWFSKKLLMSMIDFRNQFLYKSA